MYKVILHLTFNSVQGNTKLSTMYKVILHSTFNSVQGNTKLNF